MSRDQGSRIFSTLIALGIAVAVALGVKSIVAHADVGNPNDDCIGSLTATTYPSGVASAPLGSSTAVTAVTGTGLQLNTNQTVLDPQHILLPFDQDVKVRYVYRNAGASMSLGWFYLDQINSFLTLPASNPAADLTVQSTDPSGNKIYTWFGSTGLWKIKSGQTIPDLTNSTLDFKDSSSTTYLHIPHELELLMAPGSGGMIFKLCDDDSDTNAQNSSVSPFNLLTPVADTLTAQDSYAPGNGIPDYDVNGNGTTDEVADRTVDLGTIQGGREIVFFMVNYYTNANSLRYVGLGLSETTTGKTGTNATTHNADIIPYFTKDKLNPDRGAQAAGTVVQRTAIGCGRDDNTCYGTKHDAGGNTATLGWLDPNTLLRLKAAANAADYHQLDITTSTTVVDVAVGSDNSVPHFVTFAPSTAPNTWLLGFDNKPEYSNGGSDFDYDDTVFLIDHSNGGQAISAVTSNIPSGQLATSVISKVSFSYTASFPTPGCTAVTDGSIDFYYSVDNGTTWHLVGTATSASPTLSTTIDVLGAGFVGNQLKWRADFKSSTATCTPTITALNEGYEAVTHGEFKYSAPIPLSNVVYSGSLETPPFATGEPAVTRNDFSLRGHFYSERLYDPTNPSVTALVREWDGGAQLAATNPDSRKIYSSVSGATTAFDNAHKASFEALILPGTLIGSSSPKVSGTYVYDYDGDGAVTNTDADFVLQWTRGWEYPSTITFTPAQSALQRGWKLGPVHNSSPAIVGPVPLPTWNGGSAVPTTISSSHNAYLTANSTRSTVALVGAQDGMLHAFDAGQFREGTDPTCPAPLTRGCYAGATPAIQYGSGNEQWAWIPPSLLSQLKNNHPFTKSYQSSSNPQAEVDGSIAVEDIYDTTATSTNSFRTIAYASLGREQPYITAVEITNTTSPQAIWSTDFSDASYNGSELAPSIGLTVIPTSSTPGTHTLVATSGRSANAADLYVFFVNPLTGGYMDPQTGGVDSTTGHTKAKIQLNTGSTTPSYNAQSLGFAGYPNLVDTDQDGLIDRMYAVDTSGRIFKYDLKNRIHCVIATTGETVFSGMAIDVGGTQAAPTVKLYLGGAPNPDGSGSTTGGGPGGVYRLFAFQDSDAIGTCTENGATTVYTQNLGAGEKVWAAPFTSGTDVFTATSTTSSVSICASGNGNLMDLSTTGNGTTATTIGASQVITGTAVSSLRVYDGHAVLNTIGGSTMIMGGSQWNNTSTANGGTSTSAIATMRTLLWSEQ